MRRFVCLSAKNSGTGRAIVFKVALGHPANRFGHKKFGVVVIIIIIIIYSFIKNSTISVEKMHTRTGQKGTNALTTALIDKGRHNICP